MVNGNPGDEWIEYPVVDAVPKLPSPNTSEVLELPTPNYEWIPRNNVGGIVFSGAMTVSKHLFSNKLDGWKTRENATVLYFLAVDNFDFTRKIVKKVLGEKLVKMLRFCTF